MFSRSSSRSDRRPFLGFRSLLLPAILLLAGAARADLTVAVAANLQYAFEEIRKEFTRETGVEVKPVYGASGKLQAQIRSGAPFDLFISAETDWPDTLSRQGHAVGKPQVYAFGRVVLWTTSGVPVEKGISCLLDPAVRKVAVGDLKLTVYGPGGWRAMERAGVLEQVKPKVVFGGNIGQVAQYISSGAAQAGFVGKGQIMSGPLAGKGQWFEIPEEETGRMPQAMVMTRYGADNNPKSTKALMAFLLTPKVRAILTRYGYGLP